MNATLVSGSWLGHVDLRRRRSQAEPFQVSLLHMNLLAFTYAVHPFDTWDTSLYLCVVGGL